MICCKIMTNYSDKNAQFSLLLKKLEKLGDILCANGSLFFSSEGISVTSKTIKRAFKSSGYNDCYVMEYTKENAPQEDDDTNRWLNDHLVHNSFKEYERVNQITLKDISQKLTELDKFVNEMSENQAK